MNRGEVLDSVKKIICNDRQDVHGNPENTHELIAQYWTIYLSQLSKKDLVLNAQHVAELMILFKLARNQMNPIHPDNLLDLIGYAAIAVELHE